MSKIDINAREARARELFKSGYNCAQAVAMTFVDLFEGCDPNTIASITSSFGGGLGRLREVCGAVSGMAVIAGLITPATDPEDRASKSANYTLVQSLAEAFRAQNGSIVCRELLGLSTHRDAPTPEARTAGLSHKRPCADLVGDAARIVATRYNEIAESK